MTSKLLVRFTLIFSVVGFIDSSWASTNEETPFERQTQKIITLLKNGKMTDDGAFLARTGHQEDPLKTFQDYCNMFIDLPELKEASKPWKVHLSAFVDLANAFFDYASSPNKKGEEHYWEALKDDIKERQEKKTAHYSWFMHFIDVLNIIRTPKEERAKHHTNNTRFDTHHVEVVEQLFNENKEINPDLYEQTVKSLSGYATCKIATTAALARQFPEVVEFPFPYDLSDGDIVKTYPNPYLRRQPANRSWFQGFAKKVVHADGYDMSIWEFGKHDKLHHAVIRSALSILTTNNPDYAKNPHYFEETLVLLGSMRTLFFQWLDVCQLLIAEKEQALNQATDPVKREELQTEARLTTFLTFYIFHESRWDVQRRLKQIVKPIAYPKNDKDYYGDLYPTVWKSWSLDEKVKALNDYDQQFKKDMTRIAQQYYSGEDLNARTMEALAQAEKLSLRETSFDPTLYKIDQAVEWPMEAYNNIPLTVKYWSPYLIEFNEDNRNLGDLYRFFYLGSFIETPKEVSFQEWIVDRQSFKESNAQFLLNWPSPSYTDDAGNTALHFAVNFGLACKVKELIKSISVAEKNKMGETPLDLAIAFKDQEIIKILCEEAKEKNINICSAPKYIKNVIKDGNEEMLSFLLEKGLDPNYEDAKDLSLLLLAGVTYSKFDILDLLLERGADMTRLNKYEYSFLHLVGFNNKLDTYQHIENKIKSLNSKHINYGIDLLTYEDNNGHTLLISVFFNDSSLAKKEKFIEYLLLQGANVNYKSKSYGYNVIHLLILNHRNEELKWLLARKDKYKLDINQHCNGYTPLWLDLDYNNGVNTSLLLEHGADPSLKLVNQEEKNRNIQSVIKTGNQKLLSLLLDEGLDLNYENNDGFTLLALAGVCYDQLDIIDLLLERGADMNHPNKYDLSFLTLIGANNRLATYQYVEDKIKSLHYKIDLLTHEDKNGSTLLGSVFANKFSMEKKEKFIEYLLLQGADINYKNKKYGNSVIHILIMNHKNEELEWLLKRKYKLDINQSYQGYTPLWLDLDYNNGVNTSLLLEHGADPSLKLVNQEEKNRNIQSVIKTGNQKLLSLLLDEGLDLNYENNDGFTLLALAGVCYDQLDIIDLLLERGADITRPNKYGYSFLNLIGANNKLATYQYVEDKIKSLYYKIDLLTHEDKSGLTLLSSVFTNKFSMEKKEKFIEYLLLQGADINYKNKKYGNSVIHILIMNHKNEELEWLLKRKYKLDINQSCSGYTPLWLDLRNNNGANIPLLLEHGADPSPDLFCGEGIWEVLVYQNLKEPLIEALKNKNKWGFQQAMGKDNRLFFLDYCYHNDFLEKGMEILKQEDIFTKSPYVSLDKFMYIPAYILQIKTWSYHCFKTPQNAMPPLEYALRQGYAGVMKDLVSKLGADVLKVHNQQGESLLDIAIQLDNPEAADFIQENKGELSEGLKKQGFTPLSYAQHMKATKVMECSNLGKMLRILICPKQIKKRTFTEITITSTSFNNLLK